MYNRFVDGTISEDGKFVFLQAGYSDNEPLLTVVTKKCSKTFDRIQLKIDVKKFKTRTNPETWIKDRFNKVVSFSHSNKQNILSIEAKLVTRKFILKSECEILIAN